MFQMFRWKPQSSKSGVFCIVLIFVFWNMCFFKNNGKYFLLKKSQKSQSGEGFWFSNVYICDIFVLKSHKRNICHNFFVTFLDCDFSYKNVTILKTSWIHGLWHLFRLWFFFLVYYRAYIRIWWFSKMNIIM